MKKILFLLLVTVSIYGQTYQNPTFGKVTVKNNIESTTADKVLMQETDGVLNYRFPEQIPMTIIPPTINYIPTEPNLQGHFKGIDEAFGNITQTTAGIITRVWYTADETTIGAGTFYLTSPTGKGTAASGIQSVINADNTKTYFAQDLIGNPFANNTTFPAGTYAGNLSASTDPNNAQQRYSVELYRCNNAGTPINSGVAGAPVGSLGVTVIVMLDSGLLTLVDADVTNVPVNGTLAAPFSISVGERIRYHVAAEKVGTDGGSITQSVYYGTNYNSYLDVPVTFNTSSVVNISGVTGATVTEALNSLNTLDSNVVHKTGNEDIQGIKTFKHPSYPNYRVLLNNYNADSSYFKAYNSSGNVDISIRTQGASQGAFQIGTASAYFEGRESNLYLKCSVPIESPNATASNHLVTLGQLTSTTVGLLTQTITDGDTTHAPSGDVVYDALALKANESDVVNLTGTGVINTLPKFTGVSSIGNSNIYDDGSKVTVNSKTDLNGIVRQVTVSGVSDTNYDGYYSDFTSSFDGYNFHAVRNGTGGGGALGAANSSTGVGDGVVGRRRFSGVGNGGTFKREETGDGNGVYAENSGSGTGSAGLFIKSGAGNGHALNVQNSGMNGYVSGYFQKSGSANGDVLYAEKINNSVGFTGNFVGGQGLRIEKTPILNSGFSDISRWTNSILSSDQISFSLQSSFTGGGVSHRFLNTSSGVNKQFIRFERAVDIVLGNENGDHVTVLNNGNTLMSTTSDNLQGKLQVNGNITASAATLPNQVVIKSQLDISESTVISGTAHTISSDNLNKLLIFTNASNVTITVPSGLTSGFRCRFYQQGAGKLLFTTSSSTLRYSTFETLESEEQYSIIGLEGITNESNVFKIYGQLKSI